MSADDLRANPYVGLRPFFVDDSLYFYGREQQTAELLAILREHRFLSVVGSSGSGKSSLVRAGLLPGLIGGFLVQDRDRWRTIQIKPGDAPIANLAEGLFQTMAPPSGTPSGLEAAIREQHTDAVTRFLGELLDERTNVFILVDQFEEIFSFRGDADADAAGLDLDRRKERARRHAEAADFVDLLLRLAEQRNQPIYVALTMRTDFLGECDLFYGLPEALNRGRYLVPRLTREQLRDAIECPALLLGAEMAPRLLDHVLNELGDRADRLPMLQHALLRTWDAWQAAGGAGPIDLAHYVAAGGIDGALNQDAEGAMKGLDREAVGRTFKRLTDTDSSQRRVRRPARISELVVSSGIDRAAVETIITRFEEGGRNFVYRAADGNAEDPRLDISHESLIRQWGTLATWVDEERASREVYQDLLARARKRADHRAALLQEPELTFAADWRRKEHPTRGWAARYSSADADFDSAIGYLDDSIRQRSVELAEKDLSREWRRRWAPAIAGVLAVLFVAGVWQRVPDRLSDFLPRVVVPREMSAIPPGSMARIGELTWTANDSHRTLSYAEAQSHCSGLPVFDARERWHLPSRVQLLDIYAPDLSNGFGRKVHAALSAGLTADYVWSEEPVGEPQIDPVKQVAVPPAQAYAADFKRQLMVPLPAGTADLATAFCVTSADDPEARSRAMFAPNFERARNQSALIRGIVYLGIFVTIYYALAVGGRWLLRKFTLESRIERFVALGGRPPAVETRPREDAVTAHDTVYASTPRRLTGWALDFVCFGTLVVAAFVYLATNEQRITVASPRGYEAEGRLLGRYGDTYQVRTDDGDRLEFSIRPPATAEYDDVEGADTVSTTILTGNVATTVEGRPFATRLVTIKTETGETWRGTLARTRDHEVTLGYTLDQWTQAKADYLSDLRWRFRWQADPDQSAVDQHLADWVHRYKEPKPTETAQATFALKPYNVVSLDPDISDTELVFLLAFILVGAWLYEAFQLASRRQATLGMRAVGIYRTDLYGDRLTFGTASAWAAYRVGSYLTFGLGFVVQLFSARHQSLHDRLAGSVVLRRAPRQVEWRHRVLKAAGVTVLLLAGAGSVLALLLLVGDEEQLWDSISPRSVEREWPEYGIRMFVEPYVDGRPFGLGQPAALVAETPQPQVPVEGGAAVTTLIRSQVLLAPPVRCPDGGCPVGFRYGIDSVDRSGRALESMFVASSPCDQPVLSASGPEKHEAFDRDLAFTTPAASGDYAFWIDFIRIAGCESHESPPIDSPTRFWLFGFTVK